MSGGGWRWAAASVTGSSHERSGIPCQDAHACALLHDAQGRPVLVACASDGAGSAARADRGAARACASLMGTVACSLPEASGVAALGIEAARSWLRDARAALTEQAANDGMPLRAYACTLLAAVVGEDGALFLQLGDGAIVVDGADRGGWSWVFWPQHGDYANTTFFLTDPDAIERADVELASPRIDDLALFTDGIERLVLHVAERRVFEPFFARMIEPLHRSSAAGDDAGLGSRLATYLAGPKIRERTDDDCTLVLASRRRPPLVATGREDVDG